MKVIKFFNYNMYKDIIYGIQILYIGIKRIKQLDELQNVFFVYGM